MTTASIIVSDALAEIGAIGAGETPSAEDAAFCLRKLNQILQRWSNSRLAVPTLTEVSVPLTGLQSYTIGPTGAIVSPRPIRAVSATAVEPSGIEYPVSLYARRDWDAIGFKDVDGGPPSVAWYQPTLVNGVVYVYPKATGYTLKLDCLCLLASFATLSAEVALPEGYDTALTLTLADDIASAFGAQTKPDTRRRCAAAMTAIKSANLEPLYLDVGQAGDEFMIERGY